MTKRMVITCASGFIGKQLVPRLKSRGIELLLVGRDPANLEAMFPGVAACTYGEIAGNVKGHDLLIWLAVLNNNRSAGSDACEEVNVALLREVVEEAKAAGIRTFVNVTTFHALDGGKGSFAESKRRAVEALSEVDGIRIVNLFLPAVYGDHYAGKLQFLKKLPRPLRPAALMIVSAMVPTLDIEQLSAFLADKLEGADQRVLLANNQDDNPVYRYGKKAMDLAFALTVVLFFWWLLALIWLAVRLTSRGPGIFAQERVGRYGKPFACYKFRTMKVGTKQAGTHEVSASAVTSIGRVLRKSKLDELPQVVNILRGELGLVGPRPCLPSQTELDSIRKVFEVNGMLPGITGLAQIRGIDMSDPLQLARVDGEYCARKSLGYDLILIIRTGLGGGQGDRVSQ